MRTWYIVFLFAVYTATYSMEEKKEDQISPDSMPPLEKIAETTKTNPALLETRTTAKEKINPEKTSKRSTTQIAKKYFKHKKPKISASEALEEFPITTTTTTTPSITVASTEITNPTHETTTSTPLDTAHIKENLFHALPKNFYAPQRAANFNVSGKPKERTNCPFCDEISAQKDEEFLILKRKKRAVAQLCLFPYADCHILVIPTKHEGNIINLSRRTNYEMKALELASIRAVQECFGIENFNTGMNIGPNSGASLPNHAHYHVVPRTFNTSFIHAIGNTGVGQRNLHDIYQQLKPHFETRTKHMEKSLNPKTPDSSITS